MSVGKDGDGFDERRDIMFSCRQGAQ